MGPDDNTGHMKRIHLREFYHCCFADGDDSASADIYEDLAIVQN